MTLIPILFFVNSRDPPLDFKFVKSACDILGIAFIPCGEFEFLLVVSDVQNSMELITTER